jgi:hypothetical protein
MKTYEGVDAYIHVFSTSALVGSGQVHAPATLPPGERATSTHLIGGWVGPRAGLGDMERRKIMSLVGFELRPLGRPSDVEPVESQPGLSSILFIRHYSAELSLDTETSLPRVQSQR